MLRVMTRVWAGALVLAAIASPQEGREAAVLPSVTVSTPEHWKPERAGDATALVAAVDGAAEARLRVTREERRSHAEAVERLRQIAVEVEAKATFRTIGGWAALERIYLAPVPRGHGEGAAEPEMALQVTTAIAAGADLVRFEAALAPGANPKRADEAQAIARSARFDREGDAAQAERDLRSLSGPSAALVPPPAARAAGARLPARFHPGIVRQVGVNGSEVAVAVSANGQNVVVASNGGTAFSTTAGGGFGPSNVNSGGLGTNGDPSVAWGPSGAFYLSLIGNAAGARMIPVMRSVNNGANFNLVGQPGFCAAGSGCGPDQEHLAADRVNAAPGGDQVYVAWRQFATPFGGPFLSCSQDSGVNWTPGVAVDSGDFPRITVGGDGFVYVVYRLNNNVMLHKFSSCAQGLRAQRGFPVMVAAVTDLNCPYPGLDRCNTGNTLSSHTVAVDDANPRLVFVAYASNTRSGLDGNDDVRLRASTDGGATWTAPAVMSDAGLEAKRFMPWVCATQGEAFVSWYDRRAASRTVTNSACLADCDQDRQDCLEPGGDLTPAQCSARWRTCRAGCTRVTRGASNDLTEYWSASARLSGAALQPTAPVNHSGQPDPQCASGWPFSVDFMVDSDSCSVQPQLAGFCKSTGPDRACLAECDQDWQDCLEPGGTRTPAQCHAARRTCRGRCTTPASSNQRCDFDMSTCPSGETCRALGGSPKYGDYNGNACAGGRAFFAWASATAPVGAPSTGGIRLFFDATPAPAMLTVRKSLVPASDTGRFNLRVDGRMVAGQAGDGRSVTVPVAPGAHSVSETAAGTTVAANYTTTFQGDCGPNGQVTLAAGESKTCTIVNRRRPGGNGRQECLERCEIQRQACLDAVGDGDSGVTPARCAENFARCRNGCPR